MQIRSYPGIPILPGDRYGQVPFPWNTHEAHRFVDCSSSIESHEGDDERKHKLAEGPLCAESRQSDRESKY